jgi:hypothetical protein
MDSSPPRTPRVRRRDAKPDWDEPVIEISTEQLVERFPNLAAVLGAANVTRAVRERRMRHLGDAMRAELSPARLNEYVQEVQQLTRDAMKDVCDNEIAIIREQTKRLDLRDRWATTLSVHARRRRGASCTCRRAA